MMSLLQASQILQGELQGADAVFNRVSTDTRNMQSGDLYFALRGERFDGHEFLFSAQQSGAVAAVVDEYIDVKLPQIKVADTRKALGRLAQAWRQQFRGVVIGITGSNGKTTVKEMIATILAQQGEVLATRGNFNNDIGLPLTLLRMAQEDYAVIEMGANHPGEIDGLTHITRPDIALITNAGPAHLEGFGSVQGVARAKGEIYRGLGDSGIAIINGDDAFCDYWMSLNKAHKILRFALDNTHAEVRGEWLPTVDGGLLTVTTAEHRQAIPLHVPGRHNAMNALAAIAAGLAAGISLADAARALQQFKPVKGRLNIIRCDNGLTLIDDTYNANPASLLAGLNVLMDLPGEHWLVLGDMGELGEDAISIHREAGHQAKQLGVDFLCATGTHSEQAVSVFGERARHFPGKDELVAFIKDEAKADTNILIKGSRFMKMEDIVASLVGMER
jgi:UDP-N-acetylmuramoyl-tripeptide--D-alanyl-D-alanine ligase